MADKMDYITVEAEGTDLEKLLEVVRDQHRAVRLLSGGKPVAEVLPLPRRRPLPPPDPKLAVQWNVEGHEITTEEDWPEEYR